MKPDGHHLPARTAVAIQARLAGLANPRDAAHAQRFFKTGPGEYGHGDVFRGIRVPVLRNLARDYRDISGAACEQLLASPFHEDRLLALLILVQQYQHGDETRRTDTYRCFVRNMRLVNNWDLVDSSAPYISGPHLLARDRSILYRWSASRDLWTRRIAIMTTYYFIRQGDFTDTLKIAHVLVNDPHDLIHKATGWMLREIGNRDRDCEREFLDRHAATMPRTMLRYAIEKFPERERKMYLRKTRAGED